LATEEVGILDGDFILAINLAGDILNAALARDWRTLIGLPIGLTLILLLQKKRESFA
jgi:hypothetical protein